jgi:hypothetical protein
MSLWTLLTRCWRQISKQMVFGLFAATLVRIAVFYKDNWQQDWPLLSASQVGDYAGAWRALSIGLMGYAFWDDWLWLLGGSDVLHLPVSNLALQIWSHHPPQNVRDWSCLDVGTWMESNLPEGVFQHSWGGSEGRLCEMGVTGKHLYTLITGQTTIVTSF